MSFLPNPTQRPTPSEYVVITIGASALLILGGLIGLGFRIFAAPQKPEAARMLLHYSGWSLAIGIFIACSYWLFRRLID